MAKIHSLKEYKRSLVYVPHLEAIIKVIDLTIRGLKPFKAYGSVQRIFTTLEDERVMLQLHLNKYKKIKEGKGFNNGT